MRHVRLPRFRHAQQGAVMVELLIAYLPVLLAFLMFWQLGELLVAQMVVERASSAAGRAAIVVLPDDPAFYEAQLAGSYEGMRKREVRLAAGMMLAASPHLSENFTVEVANVPAPDQSVGRVTVRVESEFRCKRLTWVCGADGYTLLAASSEHAYHGAGYEYEPVDLSNIGSASVNASTDPGCSASDTPNAGGSSGQAPPGKGGGRGGRGSGGAGGNDPDESGSCPPGKTLQKDGTCQTSRGGNQRCKDGSTVAPDGLCHDGTCPNTGKKPPADADPMDPCGKPSLACKCLNAVKNAWSDLRTACRRTPRNENEVDRDKRALLSAKQTCTPDQTCRTSQYDANSCDDIKPDCNDPTKNGGGRKSLPNTCGQCRFVYRRDTRSPSEIFSNGFSSKGSNWDLSQFIVGADTKSSFISTTTSIDIALKLSWQSNDQLTWKNQGKTQPNTDYIYKIRDCGSGVDVNKTLDPDSCQEKAVGDKIKRYQYQNEIAIPQRIEADDIVEVIQPRESDRPAGPPPPSDPAFLTWPPLTSITNHATPLPNVGYDPKADSKRIAKCKKDAGI